MYSLSQTYMSLLGCQKGLSKHRWNSSVASQAHPKWGLIHQHQIHKEYTLKEWNFCKYGTECQLVFSSIERPHPIYLFFTRRNTPTCEIAKCKTPQGDTWNMQWVLALNTEHSNIINKAVFTSCRFWAKIFGVCGRLCLHSDNNAFASRQIRISCSQIFKMWLGWLHNHPWTRCEIYLLVFHKQTDRVSQ